jgi:hypothetical protein
MQPTAAHVRMSAAAADASRWADKKATPPMISKIDLASLQNTFHTVQRQTVQLIDFARLVVPIVKDNPKYAQELSDSLVVLVVVRLEAFYSALLSHGARHREGAVRRHLAKNGHPDAKACIFPHLVRLVRTQVSFKKEGAKLDRLCRVMFGQPLWVSDEARDVILDLILLRNLIVHNAGGDWSQDDVMEATYGTQFRVCDALRVSRYGEFVVYNVDHYKSLQFMQTAILSIVKELQYLEEHVVNNLAWVGQAE